MISPRLSILLAVLACILAAWPFRAQLRRPFAAAVQRAKGSRTVADRLAQFEEAVRKRLAPDFERIAVPYPPRQMVLVGLKAEQRLQVWVAAAGGWQLLREYPVLGQSGTLGPKLREGDRQVPEGIYPLESLNPNSLYHLSLRVGYPNAEDLRRGRDDGRPDLGGDIMIHGNTCSIGCLAMGDEAAEDLFVLAARTGPDNVRIILSPVDFRLRDLPPGLPPAPAWTADLYESIRRELEKLQAPRLDRVKAEQE